MAKRTKAESLKIKSQIFQMIIDKFSRDEIIQNIQRLYGTKEHSIGENQIDRYTKQAREEYKNYKMEDLDSLRKRQAMKLERMAKRAEARQDHKLRLECEKEINKISGLHQTNINLTGSVEVPIIKVISEKPNE